jgi:putative CocE/NonD family hydrolase
MRFKRGIITVITLVMIATSILTGSRVSSQAQKQTDMTQQVINLILKDLPASRNEEGHKKEYKVAMRDGVTLNVQAFFPKGKGPWPTIMIRNPYASFKFFNEAILRSFTRYGYAGVLVDQRGTAASEGKWEPFENERNDGIDILDWLVEQEWMNGNIGLFGHSYLGFSQWVIADELPPEVKTMFISAFGTNRYSQMYESGMFRHDIYTHWAVSNSGIETEEKPADLYKKAYLVRPHIEMDTQIFGQQLSWYRDWLMNVSPETQFWETGMWADLKKIPQKVNIPVFMKVGWYDHHLDGMVEAYENLPENIKKQSRLLIGPWVHSQNTNGDIEYPNSDIAGIDGTKVALEWFDHYLKGMPYSRAKAVESYVVRDGVWKVWDKVPTESDTNKRFYLSASKGLGYKGGSLEGLSRGKVGRIKYTYDPNNPVPTVGGEVLLSGEFPNGNKLQSEPGAREDVLTFISEPLKEDMLIAGRIKVRLNVSSDAEDTAFTAKIMEVFPDGKAYNIRDSITSLAYRNGATTAKQYKPGSIIGVKMEMWPVTWTIKKGSRIRLDISSSNFPAYHVHPNTAGSWALQKDTKKANQTIYVGGGNSSYIELPVAE